MIRGAFVSGNKLYFADKSDGYLRSLDWAGDHAAGTPMVVDTSRYWGSESLFVESD